MNSDDVVAKDETLAEGVPYVAAPVVLKIHDNGYAVRIVKLDRLPVTIGRSVRCDVVIEHPGISSTHARLERDAIGSLVLCDVGSKNGLWHDRRRVDQVHVRRNASVQLSDVRLEIVVAESLESTRIDRTPPESSRVTASRVLLVTFKIIACYGMVLLAHGFRKFADDWPPERPAILFGDAFWMWAGIFCLTGVLALFNKLHAKRYDATRLHLIMTGVAAFLIAKAPLDGTLAYNLRLEWLRASVPLGLSLAAVALGLHGLLRTMFASWPRRRHALVALAMVATGHAAMQTYSTFEFAAGSRRVWDEDLGMPLVDPTVAALPTSALLEAVDESIKAVDGYRAEDWQEVLSREREDEP